MPTTPLAYRLRVRNEDDTADELVVTSLRNTPNPYIENPPVIDAQSLDPIAGRVTIGQATLRVIDAITQAEAEELVASDGFEYANIAALEAAGWAATDTIGAPSTWSIETSVIQEGARSLELLVSGAVSAGQSSFYERTFTGLTPLTAHVVRLPVWLNEEAAGSDGIAFGVQVDGGTAEYVEFDGPINDWTDLEASGTTDASGNLTIRIGAFDAINANYNRLSRFDDLRIYEVLSAEGRVVTSKLADADGRRNLVGRKGILEESTNNGSAWTNLTTGYVTGLRLVTALVYEFTISDTPLDRSRQLVFQVAESGDGYDFSRVSFIIGGPVIGDFGPHKDLGRPKFRVTQVGVAGDADLVTLKWIDGGGPIYEAIKEYHPGLESHNRDFLNGLAEQYKVLDGDLVVFDDLVCRLFDEDAGPDTTTGLADHDFTPIGYARLVSQIVHGAGLTLSKLLDSTDSIIVRWPASGTPAQPNVGDIYKVAVFPRTISTHNPVHVTAHPVAMAGLIASARGMAFTSASATAITNALGPDLLVGYRITKAMTVREALERLCFGPFGFAWRQTETGEYEFILSRQRSESGPVDTIGLNDLVSADGVIWEDSEPEIVDTVNYTVLRYSLMSEVREANAPIDYIEATPQKFEVIPNDLSAPGNNVQQFDIPGELRLAEGELNLVNYFAALGQDMFAVFRNGAPTGTIHVLRGSTSALLGDEIALDLPHRPAVSLDRSPTAQRGSPATVVQILRRQPVPSGLILYFQDRGTADTTDDDPTFSLAASVSSPKKVVTVTITNPTDLQVAGITNVRVEMAVGGSPTGYVFVRNWIPGVDDPEFDLPAVDAGSVVNVRMRSEITGQLPGTYTAADDIDLADLTAPSGLSTAVSGTQVTMAWTVGEASQPVEVLYRRDADSTFTTAIVLAAGSTDYVLTLPDETEDYVVGVRHREAPPFNGVSASVTDDLTTGTAGTLDPPINPAVFSDGEGRYGLEVTATEFPSDVLFQEAIETAVGSGTPGAYADAGTVTSVQGGRTRLEFGPVPNDGKLRYLKAQHVANGFDPSTFTGALSVNPWAVVTPTQDTELSYVTADAEATLPNSRRLIAGSGVTLTDNPGAQTLEVAVDASALTGHYEPFVDNSDPDNPDLVYLGDGDLLMLWVED